MEDQKKKASPRKEGGTREGGQGQRISVRPGNFTPPPRKGSGSPAPANGAAAAPTNAGGESRNGNRPNHKGGRQGRHQNRHQGRPEGNRPEAAKRENRPAPTGAESTDNGGKNPRNNRPNGARPHAGGRQNPRHHEEPRRENNRPENARPKRENTEPPVSSTLLRELEEDFSTPLLTGFYTSSRSGNTATPIHAVETDEFAVDIAAAAYLVEDIPCGFPIPDGKAVEVVGVRFRQAGKAYFFAPAANTAYRIGDAVLVDTARGPELGDIVMLKRRIAEKDVIQPLRSVLRHATEEDLAHYRENLEKEAAALKICAEKIAAHKLDMRLVDAQYTFDNSKLLFYFTSEGRVDFRELVRDLASVFRTRIELRQIGIRDESRLIGGLGICGRPFCCSTFLSDFGQVSIKMAKEQGLSINTSKISGCCGRLMCCLRYEHETYAEETRLTPKKDTPVATPDGNGVVIEAMPLAAKVKVRLDALPEEEPRIYHRDSVTVLNREKPAPTPEKPEDGARNTPTAPADQPPVPTEDAQG